MSATKRALRERKAAEQSSGIVYTEDGVPVYTLYLANIPHQKTEHDIETYFSSFGVVETVQVHRKFRKRVNEHDVRAGFQYGFVTFACPESAARALQSRNHSQVGKRFCVKRADTWKQPKFAQDQKRRNEITENPDVGQAACSAAAVSSKVSMMELNDDCVGHIFSFLKQQDLFRMSFVCQRFFGMVEREIRVKKYLDFEDIVKHFTLKDARSILSSFGEHIRRLTVEGIGEQHRRYIEFIGVYCRHLEEMNFRLLSFNHETYKRIFQSNMQQLKVLRFELCEIKNNVCSLTSKLPALETLKLSSNIDITGLHLEKLRSLRDLNLSHCNNFRTSHFIGICQANKLKKLNIVECHQLDDGAFEELARTQTELESLTISVSHIVNLVKVIGKLNNLKDIRIQQGVDLSDWTNVLCELSAHQQETIESLELYGVNITAEEVNREHILKLRNVKKLSIVGDRSLDDDFLGEIAKHLKNVEELNIAVSSALVSEMGITNLVSNLKNLKLLDVSYCSFVSYSLVRMIYNVFESSKGEHAKPMKLFARETMISNEHLEGPDYQMHRKLVTASFDMSDENNSIVNDDYSSAEDSDFDPYDSDFDPYNSDFDPYDSDYPDGDYDLDDLCFADVMLFR